MNKVFHLPVQLLELPDDEFWQRLQQLDNLSEEFEETPNGFAITLNNGDKQLHVPFIRFTRTFPKKSS